MTLTQFLESIESREKAATLDRQAETCLSQRDVKTLLAMLRLAIEQRDNLFFHEASEMDQYNAALLKLAGIEE